MLCPGLFASAKGTTILMFLLRAFLLAKATLCAVAMRCFFYVDANSLGFHVPSPPGTLSYILSLCPMHTNHTVLNLFTFTITSFQVSHTIQWIYPTAIKIVVCLFKAQMHEESLCGQKIKYRYRGFCPLMYDNVNNTLGILYGLLQLLWR